MSRLGCTALVIGCLIAPMPLQAATVTIDGDNPKQSITVTIEDAKVAAVLDNLHKRYGFEVLGLKNVNHAEALSATMTGTLQSVIERLLRNWNHMIVRSPDNAGGIAKVMILNADYGAAPQHARQEHASGKGSDKLMQALTGM